MKEFRKMRIQREIAEILGTFDQIIQPQRATPGNSIGFHPRHTILALIFGILGILMGQGVALKAIEADPLNPYQYTPLSYSEQQPLISQNEGLFPELPDIEIVYAPI